MVYITVVLISAVQKNDSFTHVYTNAYFSFPFLLWLSTGY